MIDINTLLYNNGKLAVYKGVNIHGLYHYLEMIVAPKTFTTSGQFYCYFVPSFSTNNDTVTIQTITAALCMRQKII